MLLCDPSRARKNNLDFLRFFFAILVIFSHSYPLMAQDGREPLRRLTHGGYSLGQVAVQGFFIISGYLILHSWLRSKSARDYFTKRCLRIYPGFLVACLVCFLVVAPLASKDLAAYHLAFHPRIFLLRTLLLQQPIVWSAFYNTHFQCYLSGSMWTIVYEFGCYILVAVTAVIGLWKRCALFAALTALLLAVNCAIQWHPRFVSHLPKNLYFDTAACFQFIAAYAVGCVFYLYRERIPRSPGLLGAAVAGLVFSVGLPKAIPLLFPVCMAYSLFYFAFAARPGLTDWTRWTRGDLSYGVYLYAWPVQMLLIQRFAAHLNPTTVFILATPITMCLAVASWHLIEKPALALKPGRKQQDYQG